MTEEPLLSLCMIVRDEAQRLPGCLDSVEGLVDEVVLVDTGSQDATVEVAQRRGCRVLHHEWQDDFAAARNVGLDAARGRWVLVLDADELLSGAEGFDLRTTLAGEPGFDLALLRILTPDHDGEQEEVWAVRLFRNGRGFRFRHPVHEQLAADGGLVGEVPLTVLHLGCLDEPATRLRQARYLDLLGRLPEDDPHRAVFTVRGLVALSRWDEIEPWAQRAYKLLPADHAALPRLLFQAAVAAFNRDDRSATATWLRRGLSLFPEHPDLRFAAMAHEAWLCRLAHHHVQDPAHPLFRKVGDSARWLGAVESFLEALGVRGSASRA